MQSYTFNKRLPDILLLQAANRHDEEEMLCRFIALHTPTGGIVEILPGKRLVPVKDSTEIRFKERTCDGETFYYTAILHNKEKCISPEDGIRAMKTISKWFIHNPDETVQSSVSFLD